jgi:hypothetical protein
MAVDVATFDPEKGSGGIKFSWLRFQLLRPLGLPAKTLGKSK